MIEEVPVVVYCPACKAEKTLSSIQQFCCPNCGTLTSDLVKGRELEIVAIEIEETVPKVEQVENDCRFEEVAG
jgi:hydrogenase nickel incorporation protein HypA/HybF